MTYKLGEVQEILLEIAEEIASVRDSEYERCPYCGVWRRRAGLRHTDSCPIRRLRKLLEKIDE